MKHLSWCVQRFVVPQGVPGLQAADAGLSKATITVARRELNDWVAKAVLVQNTDRTIGNEPGINRLLRDISAVLFPNTRSTFHSWAKARTRTRNPTHQAADWDAT